MKNRISLAIFLLLMHLCSWAQIGGDYNPTNPSDPGNPTQEYTLKLKATPTNGGSFNTTSTNIAGGKTYNLSAYPSSDFAFVAWLCNGDTLSKSSSYTYTMPYHDVEIIGVFTYSPSNPSDPNVVAQKYTLTLKATPSDGGSFNAARAKVSVGERYNLRAYPNTDFVFVAWLCDGDTLSKSASYDYTMPSHNVDITGVFTYRPSSPSDPQEQALKYQLSIRAVPVNCGSFNISNERLAVGSSNSLRAYANTDFVFKHWMIGDKILSTNANMDFVMPSHNVQMVGVFEYNPASPANPNRNHWDKQTGEVIVDDFTPGNLSSAISSVISGSSSDDVQLIIVSGRITNNDFGIANNYKNCSLLDLSRVTGVTEIPSYAFDYTNLETVYLPATIEKIGYRAFAECTKLSSLTIYAMTPPTLESQVFQGVPDGLVVYVPAAAISQYQDMEAWGKFTLLPIQEDIRSISISLPEGANASDYTQMWLELTNVKSGQRMHYVMTNRQTYTFANIIRNTSWNVTLRNERGDVFGHIDNVEVKDEDVSVTFASLSKPQNVSLVVKTPGGQDVTAQTQITWTDAQGNYVAQGASLTGLPAGYQTNYRVALSQELAMQYDMPQAVEYVLKDGGNSIVCQLQAIKQLQISGKVKDAATGLPLSGAVVSASQTFGGKYSKTLNAKTDSKGLFTLTIANVPTSVAFTASDYVSQTMDFSNNEFEGLSEFAVPDVSLKSITGATISVGFTYTSVDGEAQNWYSDYQNVSYTLYNITREKPIGQFNVQYPQIVLLEEVEDGDVLRLTATSRTNAFMPVAATATIAEQKAEATFDIVELGQIQSSFTATGNASVVGSLYDAAGKLVKTYDYANASLTISNLADGNYTLVTMGSSRLFNTIYDLEQLPQTGLVEDVDYVVNTVEVKSGAISQISIDEVPTLDESKLYYTGDNTSFTVNKPSIVAGNYLTLTGRIDFKPAYATGVSNVQMIVDLPESCEFVENSVMVGNSTSSYTLDGNRITIPMPRYTDRVRFCIIPTLGGEYAPSAFAQFDLDGETVTQPIGSANYAAKDLSISVPSTVAKTSIPVSGTAIGTSNVEIYDNDVLIGQTTSLSNGTWATTCELNEPYNLSSHNIYAKVTTKQGIELTSENVSCVYDMNAIQVSKVTMYHWNPEMRKNYEIVYDFLNPSTEDQYYIYYIYNKVFTFKIEFTANDTTRISNVVLNVKTGQDEIKSIPATFDTKSGIWIAEGEFGNMYDGNIPINVSVDYSCRSEQVVDRIYVDNNTNNLKEEYISNFENRDSYILDSSLSEFNDSIIQHINELIDNDDTEIEEIKSLYKIYGLDEEEIENVENEDLEGHLNVAKLEYEEWKQQYAIAVDSLAEEFFFGEPFSSEFSVQIPQPNGSLTYSCSVLTDSELHSLLQSGYNSIVLSDSTYVYYKYHDDGYEYIDAKKHTKYVISKGSSAGAKGLLNKETYNSINKCASSAATTIKNIKAAFDNGKLSVAEAADQFSVLFDFLECYYSAILIGLDVKLTSGYNEALKDYDNKILSRENLRKKYLARIDHYTDLRYQSLAKKNDVGILLTVGENRLLTEELSVEEFSELSKSCEQWKNEYKIYSAEVKSYGEVIKKENSALGAVLNQLDDLKKGKNVIQQAKNSINKLLAKLPKKITPGGKIGKIVGVGGKLAGIFGAVINVWSTGCDVAEAAKELKEWGELEDAIERRLPCPKDHDKAITLKEAIHRDAMSVLAEYITVISSEIFATAVNLDAGIPVASPTWWIGSVANVYAEWVKFLGIQKYQYQRGEYYLDIMYLKCTGKEPDDPRKDRDKDKNRKHEESGNKDTGKGIDPSGYVFEGVAANRIEGVTATIYYKEDVEDMYGDLHENIVKWDAAEYAQENPLFTDENGFYRWDVPQGLWQVKFEKEGYETTYSEWLPVPPPQLDVNIAMKQNRQPEVKAARAYEDAVEVEFDKYMMPELLTTDNIRVITPSNSPEGGEKVVEGTLELLNEEVSYEGETETFASKVRFNATEPFDATEVKLLVSNRVKSYAGIRMQDDYQQTFTIEQEIKEIQSDSAKTVGYGDKATLIVNVLPASASKGKTLTVKTSSPMILGVETEQVSIGNDGKAEVMLSGELPGTAALTFSVEGTDKTATTIANVEQNVNANIATPTANIASGTVVEKGTAIILSCTTEGATIYYTTDGTCPCDETGSRKVYDGTPIVIGSTVTIKAMAVAPDLTESDVAEFVYTVQPEDEQGDVNGDGKVNGTDLVLLTNLIMSDLYGSSADMNNDGKVNGTDYVLMVNVIMNMGQNAKAKSSKQLTLPASLTIEDFDIKAGETKEMLIDLRNINTDVTLVQFDLRLPAGLSIATENGTNIADIAGRTTWKKHTLLNNNLKSKTRFLLCSSTNALITGSDGAIIKIGLTAADNFDGGTITLENQLIVTPAAEETVPATYRYVIGGTSSVDASVLNQGSSASDVFTLNGSKVRTKSVETKSLPKGIYITNGQKITIK